MLSKLYSRHFGRIEVILEMTLATYFGQSLFKSCCFFGLQGGVRLGSTDIQGEQLTLLKFTEGLSVSVHTEALSHFDLQREMS